LPLASREEAAGGGPDYPCCTFRGSIVALDANTGKQIWKQYIIEAGAEADDEELARRAALCTVRRGIWDTPTIR